MESKSFTTPCVIKTTEEGGLIVEDQEGHEIEIRRKGPATATGGHTTKFML